MIICYDPSVRQPDGSEYAMKATLVEALNAITGAHPQSATFWSQEVLPGVLQRFGKIALSADESPSSEDVSDVSFSVAGQKLWNNMVPFLNTIVRYVLHTSGMALSEQCEQDCQQVVSATAAPAVPTLMNQQLSAHRSQAASQVSTLRSTTVGQDTDRRRRQLRPFLASAGGDGVAWQDRLNQSKSVAIVRFRFSHADLVDGALRVKHMTLIDYAQGKLLHSQAMEHLASAVSAAGESKDSSFADPSAIDGRVASRLLALSAEHFADALRSEPSNTHALREATLAAVEKYLVDGQILKADDHLLSSIERLLTPPGPISQLLLVIRPLFLRLFDMWDTRRVQRVFDFGHLAGGASRSILERAASATELYAAQITHAKNQMSAGAAAAAMRRPSTLASTAGHPQRADPFCTFVEDIRGVTVFAFLCASRFFEHLTTARDDGLLRMSRLSRYQFNRRGLDMTKMDGLVDPAAHPAQYAAFYAMLASAAKPAVAQQGAISRRDIRIPSVVSQECDLELVAVLKEIGFNVNQRAPVTGHTPLIKAVLDRDTTVARFLLRQCRVLIDEVDQEGCTALIHATSAGHADMVELLLTASPPANVNLQDANAKQTALHKAAVFGFAEIAERLLKAGADLSLVDYEGMTALHRCSIRGHMAVAKAIAARPQCATILNLQDDKLSTALLRACTHGYVKPEYVDYLCSLPGIDLNKTDDKGKTALMRAVDHDEEKIVQALIKAKANVHARNANGRTALLLAVLCAIEYYTEDDVSVGVDIMKQLLDAGSDPNAVDKNNCNVLILACIENRTDLMQGTDVSYKRFRAICAEYSTADVGVSHCYSGTGARERCDQRKFCRPQGPDRPDSRGSSWANQQCCVAVGRQSGCIDSRC